MELPAMLKQGSRPRLIPVAADSSHEGRATGILLAALENIPSFSAAMLTSVGQRIGARSKISCLTEVVFQNSPDDKRPDGLITSTVGSRTWTSLVEAKIKKAEIDDDQLKSYIDLAKANSVDALITISNQFSTLPTHHPVELKKSDLKGIEVFHWSWMFVLTQASLLLNDPDVSADQRYLLGELVRYFSHPSTGVSSFDQMNKEWKTLVEKVQTGAPVNKSDPDLRNSVASWYQEQRDLCLLMSRRLKNDVRLKLPRKHISDPAARLDDDCAVLASTQSLFATFQVPDAAGEIEVEACVARRTIGCAIHVAAPADRKSTSARVNWLTRQLKDADPSIYIKAYWPGRTDATQRTLGELREAPDSIDAGQKNSAPTRFEVRRIEDLAREFSAPKKFIERLESIVPSFYSDVAQRIRPWTPPPPKISNNDPVEETEPHSVELAEADNIVSPDSQG